MYVCVYVSEKERERGSRFLTLVSHVGLATNLQWGKIRHRRFISNTGPCSIHEAGNLKKITHKAYWTTWNMVALPVQQRYYIYVVLDPQNFDAGSLTLNIKFAQRGVWVRDPTAKFSWSRTKYSDASLPYSNIKPWYCSLSCTLLYIYS